MVETCDLQALPKKQQQLITAAKNLLLNHGLRRVTIKEICKNANVSKMTFYKYYNNKLDIAKAVLDVMFYEGLMLYNEIIEVDIPLPKKVEEMLKFIRERFTSVGEAFINDLLNEDSPLHQYFFNQHKNARELAMGFFKNIQKDGLIRSDIKLPFLLFMLDNLSVLVNHPDFIKIMPNIEDRICELSSLLFHGFTRTTTQAE